MKKEELHKINENIIAPVVRLVGENMEPRILSLREALEIARSMDLDLVEISPQANPPVCKVMEYQKYLYELKKKQKEIKAKSAKISVKEIRLGPNTDEHDFNFKVKHAISFLQEGNKVKVDVFFKGRSIMYKDQGEAMLQNFAKACEEYGKPEQPPRLEGKRLIMILSPTKK
ncbi:MAG: translation initiation factor IF-3 [Bacteroidales bacterium]|nr:translation initiation factor IF-3 [Bacteroidales bacterium]